MIEKQTGKQIKHLRTYNGLEFCFGEFDALCKTEGIVRHHKVHHTPQQNGVAERMNRTIMEKVRCLLSNAGLSKSFWAEAASTACFLINLSPSTAIDKRTPLEVWSAYAHVDNGKLEPRSVKCVFLSYKSGVKGYKLWCPETHKTIISRDVSFYETSMLQGLSITDSGDTSEKKPGMQVEFPIEFETTPEHLSQPNLDMHDEVDSTIQQPSVPPQYTIARDRPMSD